MEVLFGVAVGSRMIDLLVDLSVEKHEPVLNDDSQKRHDQDDQRADNVLLADDDGCENCYNYYRNYLVQRMELPLMSQDKQSQISS